MTISVCRSNSTESGINTRNPIFLFIFFFSSYVIFKSTIYPPYPLHPTTRSTLLESIFFFFFRSPWRPDRRPTFFPRVLVGRRRRRRTTTTIITKLVCPGYGGGGGSSSGGGGGIQEHRRNISHALVSRTRTTTLLCGGRPFPSVSVPSVLFVCLFNQIYLIVICKSAPSWTCARKTLTESYALKIN